MSKLKNLLTVDGLKHTIATVTQRFPFPFVFATALATWLICWLFPDNGNHDHLICSVCWVLCEGFMLTLAINIFFEFSNKKRLLKPAIMTAVGLVCADLMVLLTRNDIGTAETIGRSALVSALTVAIFFLPVVRGYSRKQLWLYTVKQFTVFATAEFIGIVLCIAVVIISSTIRLLFCDFSEKTFISALIIAGMWIPTVYYLSQIPKRRYVVSKSLPEKSAVGAFCKNVLLPIVLIYTAILYIYLIKIIAQWELPQTSVTWMVTGLMVVSLVMLYGLQRYAFGHTSSKKGELLWGLTRRWLPVVLLPLLVLMTVGLVYRLREYGITATRLYVMIFNIWAYSVIFYMLAKRDANINNIASSFAAAFVLVSVIPGLNITSVSNSVIRSHIFNKFRENGIEQFPMNYAQARQALATMNKKEANNLASQIEYLDNWHDHSLVNDIISSNDKVYAHNILPVRYADKSNETANYMFELKYDGPVDVVEGYKNVEFFKSYHRSQGDKKAGLYEFNIKGDYRVSINVDSINNAGSGSKPLQSLAVSADGDTVTIVFTELSLNTEADNTGSKVEITHAEFYLFRN